MSSALTISFASLASKLPISEIFPSDTAMSVFIPGEPVPSITVPSLIIKSNIKKGYFRDHSVAFCE